MLDLIVYARSLPPMPGQAWEPLTSRAQDPESQDGSPDAAVADSGGDGEQADFCLGLPMFDDTLADDLARLEENVPQVPLPGPSEPVILGVPGQLSVPPPAAPDANKGGQMIPVATPCRGSTSATCLGAESEVTTNANVPHASGLYED